MQDIGSQSLSVERVAAVVAQYAQPSSSVFPLCAESLAPFFSRWAECSVDEQLAVAALRHLGYEPCDRRGRAWPGAGSAAWFRLSFVRDYATRGLFPPLDDTLCPCEAMARVVRNGARHTDRRMKLFCRSLSLSPELCRRDVADGDVADYLVWLARHTAAPRSVLAATLHYFMQGPSLDGDDVLTPEQFQFIRENPQLIPID